ncbi:MAG: hypothetical protein AUJ52_14720 [Elusimicrobia bacterium CG1_02_63_36]|nr:MAG: hypothetical protein AUJ52_14720 [Elusimicrobia bacterium CG1_02_63_36]PIP83871.1 MAG: ATP-dependent exonuclease SbcCD, C subunit-like protein [Elusimicrobia bacterium CG22_combo_CG10-13_8_21_14_all_63_91]PJA17569.1 MAG: ATP-dependent exonuclease SbcCD, C subunit-like protein [Elusimicrobia bacterium CG_4_10_14_0_2_um_filter_63_34]PJB25658.1 MAG: ATP-dependent exonuclease SbcCD, C subunit-like protein [Elusimicrobia bacterium CG_4_9_14_3_um_filter_62_55]
MKSMETAPLDFAASDDRAGFRLHRFETLNWGTFHKNVWKMEPAGDNALLTGDIGSGKSTLVDALTTLLVPSQRIVYNQAAGAERRERSLLSYVKGFYKSEKDQTRFAAKAVSLRKGDSYSVILGFFYNEGYSQGITLAQVFWTKGDNARPERFYAIAGRPLSIAEDFSNFGKEIAALKRKLRKKDVSLFDSFSQYGAEFRRRMDIRSDQALELFYQTVSLKSVGNLTDFVREHMLDEPRVQDQLEEIRRNFENLDRAHMAVLKAKDQIGRLAPLVEDCDQCAQTEKGIGELTRGRSALEAYFADKKISLLNDRIARLQVDQGRLSDRITQEEGAISGLRHRRAELQKNIYESGGSRLESLSQEIGRLERERREKEEREKEYAGLCSSLGLAKALDVEAFHENKAGAEKIRTEAETEKEAASFSRVQIEVRRSKRKESVTAIERELESLRGRTSNIPRDLLELRGQLCGELDLEEASLPFVGELIQVRSGHAAWEGAIERVLHGYGLSMLVPDEAYGAVAQYVNRTHLGKRLVYFRIRDEQGRTAQRPSDKRQLLHKVEIKPDTPFREWLEQDLIRHFNYACCESLEEFQREIKALTRQGQLKSQGRRHEKDDRFRLEDRSRYVLGWSNEGKILVLEEQLSRLVEEEKKDIVESDKLRQAVAALEARRDAAAKVLWRKEFQEIDWRSVAKTISDLEEEKARITKSSKVLQELQSAMNQVESDLDQAEKRLKKNDNEKTLVDDKLATAHDLKGESAEVLGRLSDQERDGVFPLLKELEPEALGDRKLTVESCDNCQTEMRKWIQGRLDADQKRERSLRERISKQMEAYKTAYPLETREVDGSWESADEFRVMLQRLKDEDLPRHEEKFKKLMNEGTINDIALFQNQLERECEDIQDKISRINKSLCEIDYNPGTFIELVLDRSPDVEIGAFRQQLRDCLGDTLAGDDGATYNEHKFLQVKAVIDRFSGREGMTELDQKWTRKVTDVRNWFEFLVNEKWMETDEVKETYSDSSGKSGGQKEKLAYTILASALAYQFGLGWGESRSRSFRFVMIDEAFGRGSDESARYALNLFKNLNLQLLVVTPLQKIHIIEDYVRSVHFVHNPDGKTSLLKSLSIEQYQEERELHKQKSAAA